MEPIFKDSGKLKGTEVLFFDDVELTKTKSGSDSFAAVGTLSVLYFKEFNRFILHLNDWRYPLMRRIPITSEGSESGSFTLSLPALNGFSYTLRFPTITNSAAFSNFQTILSNNSGFTPAGGAARKLEASPDDKFSKFLHPNLPNVSGITHKFTEVINAGVSQVKHLTSKFKPTSKSVSTKKRTNLSDIKNKNFKKEAHSTFKKDFFSTEEGLSKKFLELRSKRKPHKGQRIR